MKIGKAKFGGQYQQRKYFKMKEGSQAFRILPPLGELADSGRWSFFHSVHYGYKTSDGKQKPFLSSEVKNRQSHMIEVPDAAKERIASLKAKLEEAQKNDNKPVFEKLNVLVGPTGMYNLDNNHYLNVVDAQGNIGVLKLRHKAKLALDVEIKKLNAEGIDPTSLENGRFFIFNRCGMGRDTTFSVSVLKEKLTVAGVGVVERDVVHVVDEEMKNRFSTEAQELANIFKRFTAEEVSKIVSTSDLMTGVSTYLDELFKKSGATAQVFEEALDQPDYDTAPTVTATPTTLSVAPPTPSPLLYTAASAVSPVKVAPKAPVAPKITPKSTAAVVTEMSDTDFLSALNDGSL
jgi:hypothetical protein